MWVHVNFYLYLWHNYLSILRHGLRHHEISHMQSIGWPFHFFKRNHLFVVHLIWWLLLIINLTGFSITMKIIHLDMSMRIFPERHQWRPKTQPKFGKQNFMSWHSQLNESGKGTKYQYPFLSAFILKTLCVYMHLPTSLPHYILLLP